MSDSLSPSERLSLIKLLNSLMQQDFEALVYAIGAPLHLIPANFAAQGNRSIALLLWVNSPNGCGMDVFLEVLDNFVPGSFEVIPQALNTQESTVKRSLTRARRDLASRGDEWKSRQTRQGWRLIIVSLCSFALAIAFSSVGNLIIFVAPLWLSFILIVIGIGIHIVIRFRTMSVTQPAQAEAYLKEVEGLPLDNRLVEAAAKMEKYNPYNFG